MGEGRGGEGKGGGVGFSSVGGVPTGKNGSFFSTGVPARSGGWGVPTGGGWVSSHFPPWVGVGSDGQKGSNTGEKKVELNDSKGIIRFI